MKPVTCFYIKSNDEDSVAFRICIDAKIGDKFIDPDIWVNGIVIRPWKFKPKENRTVNQDGAVQF